MVVQTVPSRAETTIALGRREGGFLDDLPVLLRNTGRRPIEQLDTDTDRAVGDAGVERDSTVTDIDQGALREWMECVERGVAEAELVMVDRDHAVGLHPAIIRIGLFRAGCQALSDVAVGDTAEIVVLEPVGVTFGGGDLCVVDEPVGDRRRSKLRQ